MRLTWGKLIEIAKRRAYLFFSNNICRWTKQSNLVELRKTYGEQFLKKHNLKLGFMSAFLKSAATALQDQPVVNAG